MVNRSRPSRSHRDRGGILSTVVMKIAQSGRAGKLRRRGHEDTRAQPGGCDWLHTESTTRWVRGPHGQITRDTQPGAQGPRANWQEGELGVLGARVKSVGQV